MVMIAGFLPDPIDPKEKFVLDIFDCQQSLYEFLKQAWSVLEGSGSDFTDGWHLQAIAEHLEACYRREIKRLIINVPPRSSKTTLVSIAFPAWLWIQDSSIRLLCASYSHSLSQEHSLKCRRLIQSEWYQQRWGHLFSLVKDRNTTTVFENSKKGVRACTSVGGTVTGAGGNFLILDDPNSVDEGQSEVKRKNATTWYDQVWSTRLNDPKNDVSIIIQQRLHKQDLTGYLLEREKEHWTHLRLPNEFERENRCITVPLRQGEDAWQDPRTEEGEILWQRWTQGTIDTLKRSLGSYGYAGQYQQRPAPEEGGFFKRSWFRRWEKDWLPRFSYVLQSWDTALTAQDLKNNSWSACTTWGVFREPDKVNVNSIMLLSLWRGKIEQPDLLKRLRILYKDWKEVDDDHLKMSPEEFNQYIELKGTEVDMVLIENKASGYYLLSELRRTGVAATGFDPGRYGDKIERVYKISPLVETGRIWVVDNMEKMPFETKCGKDFIENCAYFPNADDRDVVDTLTQAVIRLRESKLIAHALDNPIVTKEYM